MKKILLAAMLASPLFAGQAIVRVYGTEAEILSAQKAAGIRSLDRVGGKIGLYTDFWAHSDGEIMALRTLNLPVKVVDPDPLGTMEKSKASYRTWAQASAFIESLPGTYPNICVLDTVGWSYEGRPIYLLKISDNPSQDEDEPEVLIMGLHHAREWPALETPLFIVDSMTRAYGSDGNITNMVDNREIYFIPCVNPDGYVYSHDNGHDWRQNRHYFPQFGTYGTDLNRNYDGSEDGDPWGMWGAVDNGKATHNPIYSTHTGTLPGDSEVAAVMEFVKSHHIDASLSFHTYSELVLWPLGYTASNAPDDSLLTRIGQAMASAIGGYVPEQGSDLYPTSGDSDDWIYGWSYYTGGRITPAYTVEEGSSFQPPTWALDTIVVENFRGAMVLIQEADHIHNDVIPYPVIGSITAPETSHTTTFTVSWTDKNPKSNTDLYQLQQMTGYNTFTDDAESDYGYLSLYNWSRSTARAHSGSYSYGATNSNSRCDVLSTQWPFYVSAGDSLSFWLWYDTEDYYDVVEVAVSENGRDWEFLDCFWGSSNWTHKAYDLSPWAGKWLYFAIMYMTDDGTRGQGVWVDDISVPYFQDTVTLSSNISAKSYDVTVAGNGIYYHRVKPHNTRGWADWSSPVKTVVEMTAVAENEKGARAALGLVPTPGGFSFTVPKGQAYTFSVYDVAGRGVLSQKGTGTGEGLNATGLKPGVYFGVLSAGETLRAKAVVR